MSRHLQVILSDLEHRRIQRAARFRHMSIAEWFRRAAARALQAEASGSIEKKLNAVRRAARCEYPTADIDRMLDEIEADRKSRR